MQKTRKHILSDSKVLEILNSGEGRYSVEDAKKIKNILIKFSSISYEIWNGRSSK
jgi:hypothetical protein